MIWWFLILGVSTLVVVCVAIALFVHLRRHLQKTHHSHDGHVIEADHQRQSDRTDR
ncbi:MAG TPA: hypothetical protein VE377_22495 [Candidatus Dormibacteraeota bacterium]|nr:hypothetical protein [Candidatus Dormibacteraeota bacterium]